MTQDTLREAFVPTYGKPTPIRICQACCRGSKVRTTCYQPGVIGNGKKAAKCNNCGHITTWTQRDYPRHKGLTIGQEKGVSKMRAAFERHITSPTPLSAFTITEERNPPYADGTVHVSLQAERNDLPKENMLALVDSYRISFLVGVRGWLRLRSYYKGLSSDAHCHTMAGYLAKSAGAKLLMSPPRKKPL